MKTFMKIGNYFIRYILSSPLHGLMSKNTLLIQFTGRKSGKKFTTPVNYTQEGSVVRVTSQRSRVWWRNLKSMPEVAVTIRGKKLTGNAVVLETPEQVAEGLIRFFQPAPLMAKYFKIKQNIDGSLDQADLQRTAEDSVVIEITLQ